MLNNGTISNDSLVLEQLRVSEEKFKILLEEGGFDTEEDFIAAESDKESKELALAQAQANGKPVKAASLEKEIRIINQIRETLNVVVDLRMQQREVTIESTSILEESIVIESQSVVVEDNIATEVVADHNQDVLPNNTQNATINLEERVEVTGIVDSNVAVVATISENFAEEVVEPNSHVAEPVIALPEVGKQKITVLENITHPNLKTILSLPREFAEGLIAGSLDNKRLQELSRKYRQTVNSIPECAEKSLLLLMLHFENEDVIGTYVSEATAQIDSFMQPEQVNLVLDLLEQQLFLEAITDRVIKKAIKNIRKILQETGSCNDIFNELFTLLRHIRPLDMDLMLELIDEALEAADRIKDKDVIQLLGGTGTGKSTTIHFLAGSTMEMTEVDGIPHLAPVRIINPEVESFITSPYARSETRIINALSINLATLDSGMNGEITLCDSPGFEDTGGPEIDIANGIGVVRALKGCRSVKPVVLVSGDSIGARFEGLVRLATILAALMPDLEKALPSFSYIFTKFTKDQHKGVIAKLENKKRELKPEERANRGFVALFNDIIQKAKENIFILNPLADNPFEVIDLLSTRPPIENPKENFHDFATPDSMAKLKEQLFKHKTSIEKALERVDIPLLIYKINQLAKVNETLALHESKKYYEICVDGVTNLIANLQNKITERLAICLDHGNTNVESDIVECGMRMRDLFNLEPVRAAYLHTLSNLQEYVVMHITTLQQKLYDGIQKSPENTINSTKSDNLAALVELNKMQIIAQIFARIFDNVPEALGFVSELSAIYKSACDNFERKFNHYVAVANNSLQLNDFMALVDSMDMLEQMSRYYDAHLQDLPMRAAYSELVDKVLNKLKALAFELKQYLTQERLFIEEPVVEQVKFNLQVLHAAFNTPGIFGHYSEDKIKAILVDAEQQIAEYFIAAKAQLVDAKWEKQGAASFSELFQTVVMFDHLRQNDQISFSTNKIYQDIIKQIKSYVNQLKELSVHYLKLLSDSQPGTLLAIDFKDLLNAALGLKQAKVFEGHPEGVFENELALLKEYFFSFVTTATEIVKTTPVRLSTVESLAKVMVIIGQLNGIAKLEVDVFEQEATVASLLFSFEQAIKSVLSTITQTYFSENTPLEVEKLIQLFTFLRLTTERMSEDCNQEIYDLQAKLELTLRKSFVSIERELDEIYQQAFNLQPCTIEDAIIKTEKFTNYLGFLIELKQAHSRFLLQAKMIDVAEMIDSDNWSFEKEVFQLTPDRILTTWINDGNNSSKLCLHIQSLLAAAEQIAAGTGNDRVYDVIKIAGQLRILDKYLPEGFSYAEAISRLDAAIRTQGLTLINELKLLASTGKYDEFKKQYDAATQATPELLGTLAEVIETLYNSIVDKIDKVQRRLQGYIISESMMESLRILIEEIAALDSIGNNLTELLAERSSAVAMQIQAVQTALFEKIHEYESNLQTFLKQNKFYKVESNLIGLNKLLTEFRELGLVSENCKLVQKIAEGLNQQIETELQRQVDFYSTLSFEDYAKSPPISLLNSLQEAQDINARYRDCSNQIKTVISKKINAAIEKAKSDEATAEDQVVIKQIADIAPYLSSDVVTAYTEELKTLEQQFLQNDEKLKRALQESAVAGELQKLVDSLYEAANQHKYRNALIISDAIRDTIISTADRFQQDVTKGDLAIVLLNLPKSWEDWFYYRNALVHLSKSVGKKKENLFSSKTLDAVIAKMVDLISSQCKSVVDRLHNGIDDKKTDPSCFRIIKADFDKISAMVILIAVYQNTTSQAASKEHFYSDLLQKQPSLTDGILVGFWKIADFLKRNQMMFMSGLRSNDLSGLRPILDAAQENQELLQQILNFSEAAEAREVVTEAVSLLTGIMTYAKMNAALSERLLELKDLMNVGFLHNPELNNLDQAKQDNFYASLSDAYASLISARLLAAHADASIADVQSLEENCKRHVTQELQKLADELLTLISRMPLTDSTVYSEFNVWSDNLRSFRTKFKEASLVQYAETAVKSVERAFEDRIKDVRESLDGSDLTSLTQQLIMLKELSISLPRFIKKVNKEIDIALLAISKSRNGAQQIATLGLMLRQVEGEDQDAAIRLINEHAAFEGFAVSIRNEKTLRYKAEQVLDDLKGEKIDKNRLAQAVKEQETIYWEIVEDGLIKIDDMKKSIIANTKKISIGPGSSVEKIIKLSAHLFAYWTLENSSRYLDMVKLAESVGPGSAEAEKNYLLQPHSAQIISIFRLLGVDVDKSGFEKHLVQIGTGEGKSVTLAITAAILALLGYDIDCVCYSEYLSKRDYDAFINIFTEFGLLQHIHYGTFNQLSEDFINKEGDTRELILSYIQGLAVTRAQRGASSRNKVLLIDEVDVFFSKDFYGNSYRPLAQLQDATIFNLIEFIWNNRHDKSALEFNKLKSSDRYNACVSRYRGWEFLIETAVKQMTADIQTFEEHDYVVLRDAIGYKEQDGISFEISYGYKTVFAYFKEHDAGKITRKSRDERATITFDCGIYSYAEIPRQYTCIMGVTGTLATLSDAEKAILGSYEISKFTYMPSVYGANQLEFAGNNIRDVIIEPKTSYFSAIGNEINTRLMGKSGVKRAVLVFFESKAVLDQFYESSVLTSLGIKDKVRIITEQVNDDEKEGLIAQAAVTGNVTLVTREFGRGTDFKCYDDRLNASGGVHVIQTFVSESLSEETQIKGRTARQGNLGSYSMVILDESLERFGITATALRDMRSSGRLYDVINEYRQRFFNEQFPDSMRYLDTIREDHQASQAFISTALLPGNIEAMKEFLQQRNQYRTSKGRAGAASSASSSRTIVLMDATYSMCSLLTKAKNTVEMMFDRACQVLRDAGMEGTDFQLQFAVYRNYNCPAEQLLQYSGWESDPAELRKFLSTIEPEGGWGNEAIEIGLWHVNQMVVSTGVDQVILIGDMPPNLREEVALKRAELGGPINGGMGEPYWQKHPNFSRPTYFEDELIVLKEKGIPIHAFFVKPDAQPVFQSIAATTGGVSEALDIHSPAGAERLTDLITKRILNNIGGDNLVAMYEARYGHLGKRGKTPAPVIPHGENSAAMFAVKGGNANGENATAAQAMSAKAEATIMKN